MATTETASSLLIEAICRHRSDSQTSTHSPATRGSIPQRVHRQKPVVHFHDSTKLPRFRPPCGDGTSSVPIPAAVSRHPPGGFLRKDESGQDVSSGENRQPPVPRVLHVKHTECRLSRRNIILIIPGHTPNIHHSIGRIPTTAGDRFKAISGRNRICAKNHLFRQIFSQHQLPCPPDVIPFIDQNSAIVSGIEQPSLHHLSQIGTATDCLPFFPRLIERRKQHCRKNRDDRYYNQQFYQSK